MLDIYKKVHAAGYTYNDLKLDNILVGNKDFENRHEIRLVDFGFAERFVSPDGVHIDQESKEVFRGNMIFATQNQFEFKTTSRKDDLISMCYMLIYLLRDQKVQFIWHGSEKNKSQVFHYIRKVKTMMSP